MAIGVGFAFTGVFAIWGPTIATAIVYAVSQTAPKITITRNAFRDADGNPRSVVSFEGDIPVSGVDKLIRELTSAKLGPGDILFLSSPGGSVHGSLKLGRAVRRMGLNTIAGKYDAAEGMGQARCASSCVFVFAAGVNRMVAKGSKLGVHRFFNVAGRGDMGSAQITSAAIVGYVAEMGISPAFFGRMVKTDEISWLTPDECRQLNLVNR